MTDISAVPALCRLVSAVTGQRIDHIIGPRRSVPMVTLRDAVVWVAKREFGSSNSAIARNLGDRDPSSVSSSFHRARKRRETDPHFEAFTDFLRDCANDGSLQ